ncbi:lipoate--protein ligase [Anaerocolumna sp. MB42-C2]|uniref:lipoate--protein ligase n=1 Tax=Anaerocolumna sp. MB42-C2 TaxID=3070997 RepID=UPI0027DFC77A|nr:lipoate--protein ligase [Anaerocolumna sp. MB42-C2]WMJ88757.1 lipoate--protein ligase [Anaerocolumna sp. MB42-C2]
MIKYISYFINEEYNPYHNLALEEYLLNHVKQDECILYLWQNEKTVVIGKNQNPWKECRLKELEENDGKLVRRLSGGGAVFHDLGNLNFTFLVHKENYNLDKQLEVILKAVNYLAIPAKKTGRNDITVEGRKFSGNAFYSAGNHSYHHGTILINVNMDNLSKYLNVSRDKLVSKGVESVRSRVINLSEYKEGLTIDTMKNELIRAIGEVYEGHPIPLTAERINEKEIGELSKKYSSWDWSFGKKIPFNYLIERRLEWGNIEIEFRVEAGIIKECMAYSDSMDTDFINLIPDAFKSCLFTGEALIRRLREIRIVDSNADIIREDIIGVLKEEQI